MKHKVKNELDSLVNDLKNGSVISTADSINKKHKLEEKLEEIETAIAESTAQKQAKRTF